MAYELRDGQGSLFKNDRREKDSHPHARGEALIGGVMYEVAAWTKEGAKGKFQSLSFKPKEQRQERTPAKQQGMYERDDPRTTRSASEDLSDDLPF